MCEFGVRVCGGRPSPGGTVRADVTPPCLEGGGEDRPGYVRGGGGGAAAESEGAVLASVQLRGCQSGAACGIWKWLRWDSGTGGAGIQWRCLLRHGEAHERSGYPLLPFRVPPVCELIEQTSSPATS